MSGSRTALVTGANRGLGREVARQLAAEGWTVLLTARDAAAARSTAAALAAETGATVHGLVLDLADPRSIAAAGSAAAAHVPRLDALVHNAGAIFDPPGARAATVPMDSLSQSLQTNALGPLALTRALLALLLAAPSGANVVHVSSGMGALTDMGGGHPGYRLSKLLMNGLTTLLHAEHGGALRVNSVCPGWVRTDMGGPGATRSVEEGAASILFAVRLGTGGPSGGFFRDGQRIAW